MLTGSFSGTTFTGCPMTTLGNTMRTIMMIKFALFRHGLTVPNSFKIMAAGDDSIIIARRELAGSVIDACSNIWHFGAEM